MYLAKQNDKSSLFIYVSLFNHLLKSENEALSKEVKDIILDAKQISDGKKDIFSAPDDYFQLVSYLLTEGKEFLADLDENSIDKETFEKVKEIISQDKELV